MTIKLYFDEDTNGRLVKSLRRAGYDCLTTAEAGQLNASDEDQLALAVREGRVLVTRNKGHFYTLHCAYLETGRHHGGIIIVPVRDFKPVNRALLELLSLATAEDMQDNIEFLSHWI